LSAGGDPQPEASSAAALATTPARTWGVTRDRRQARPRRPSEAHRRARANGRHKPASRSHTIPSLTSRSAHEGQGLPRLPLTVQLRCARRDGGHFDVTRIANRAKCSPAQRREAARIARNHGNKPGRAGSIRDKSRIDFPVLPGLAWVDRRNRLAGHAPITRCWWTEPQLSAYKKNSLRILGPIGRSQGSTVERLLDMLSAPITQGKV